MKLKAPPKIFTAKSQLTIISIILLSTIILLSFMMLLIPSTANAADNKYNIRQVAKAGVNGCKFIANVQGYSGYGRPSRTFWKGRGKRKALKKAADLNATHVVWNNDLTGYGSGPRVYGEAYHCTDAQQIANTSKK